MKDRAVLARIDLIRLALVGGEMEQTIVEAPARDNAATVCARFEDGTYVPGMAALWYARVLEVPTPRWISEAGSPEATIQERAWSSPIWSAAGAP
jgi:hypothetical protein